MHRRDCAACLVAGGVQSMAGSWDSMPDCARGTRAQHAWWQGLYNVPDGRDAGVPHGQPRGHAFPEGLRRWHGHLPPSRRVLCKRKRLSCARQQRQQHSMSSESEATVPRVLCERVYGAACLMGVRACRCWRARHPRTSTLWSRCSRSWARWWLSRVMVPMTRPRSRLPTSASQWASPVRALNNHSVAKKRP